MATMAAQTIEQWQWFAAVQTNMSSGPASDNNKVFDYHDCVANVLPIVIDIYIYTFASLPSSKCLTSAVITTVVC